MEDKNIYLVVYTETEFYDPHGSPDDGGSYKKLDIIKNGDWELNGCYMTEDKDGNLQFLTLVESPFCKNYGNEK